jgi:hypothetical protein
MDKFNDFKKLVSGLSDTDWLVDCAAMPNDPDLYQLLSRPIGTICPMYARLQA